LVTVSETVRELVVLLAEDGTPVGTADKATVHGPETPYHLAFSCYAFDAEGRLLVTRRALSKRTWPGVWTNSCCGHPGPDELPSEAVRRRLEQELGMSPEHLRLVLPRFSYRAFDGRVWENELCPVFLCRVSGRPTLDPTEVEDVVAVPWQEFAARATAPGSDVSPWARLQVRELLDGGHIARFLAETEPR
jgi:isopentenyl-diphosphate delta-isomerase